MVFRMLVRWILGLYWGLYGENGEENGNYYSILGLYWVIWKPSNVVPFLGLGWDNGKENGNYYSMLGLYRVIVPLK